MTGTPPPSFTPAELEYLESRAAAIGQRGTKADQVMARFIKGGVAGLRDLSALVGLAKGDAADDMPAKDDETEGEDSNTEDTGDNVVKGEGCDDKPMNKSYGGEMDESKEEEDKEGEGGMAKGAEAVPTIIDEGVVDATDLIKGFDGRVEALQIELAEQRKIALATQAENAENAAVIKGLRTDIERLIGVVGTMGDLFGTQMSAIVKGYADGFDALRAQPPVTQIRTDARIVEQLPRFQSTEGQEGGPAAHISPQSLIKGVQDGIISQNQMALYQRTGRVSQDDDHNSKTLQRLASLSTT